MPAARTSSHIRREPGKPLPRSKPRPQVVAPWSLRNANGVQILELELLAKYSWLVHGFSTRTGGASVLPSGEHVLNLSYSEWDDREAVEQNRKTFQRALRAEKLTLVALLQFHSAVVQPIAKVSAEPSKGDASLTNAAGLLLAVQ